MHIMLYNGKWKKNNISYLAKRKLKDRHTLKTKTRSSIATGTGNFNQGTCTFIKVTEQKHMGMPER